MGFSSKVDIVGSIYQVLWALSGIAGFSSDVGMMVDSNVGKTEVVGIVCAMCVC